MCDAYNYGGVLVSNPISGEVGAAARVVPDARKVNERVSNPISGEVGAAAAGATRLAGGVI